MFRPQHLPKVSTEFVAYLVDLLGEKKTEHYLKAISTPMEKYTLHLFNNYEIIDEIKEKLLNKGYNAKISSSFPNLIEVEPKGPFELDVKDSLKEIVVDNRASEMIYQGSDVFVPGIKRANKVKKGDHVKILSVESVLVAEAKTLMSHNDILTRKKGVAAKNLLSPFKVPSLSELKIENMPLFFQSLPAYLAALNLDPGSNDRILDCCAAPGNKTIHLHELMKGKGEIVAVDRSANRLKKLDERIKAFNLNNITTIKGDILKISETLQRKFDKILVDPPCTALGLRPRLHLNINPKVIQESARYQKMILKACSRVLKPRGTLIYSTCTITKEENEEVIEFILDNSNLELVEQDYQLSTNNLIHSRIQSYVQRFIPGFEPTVGFFIVKLQKNN